MDSKLISLLCALLFFSSSFSQVKHDSIPDYDTFFLAKQKGLLGRLGRSISEDRPQLEKTGIIKNTIPYSKYKNHWIRNINITRLGFDRDFDDTLRHKKNIGIRIAETFHKNTKEKIIRSNLFFKEGDRLFPLLLADNERHLREQPYLQDARIIVRSVPGSKNEVDVLVITKDVFSIGGSIDISSNTKGTVSIKDENFAGNAEKIEVSGLYNASRTEKYSFGGEYLKRNILWHFADWRLGFRGYGSAFNGANLQESYFYTAVNRPLVSPYLPWAGSFEAAFHKTKNVYSDTNYFKLNRYQFYNLDGWIGYNLGTQKLLRKNLASRLRKFLAIRGFKSSFQKVPGIYENQYYFLYADFSGVLGSVTIFNQEFYKTKYIYGFGGRYEDVPEGFSASASYGWTDKNGRSRPYYGLELQRFFFTNSGHYFNFLTRAGAFTYQKKFQDISLLFNTDFFTKLFSINHNWSNRNFIGLSVAREINYSLNEPLMITGDFGIPYVPYDSMPGDFRTTLKVESVFYSPWKLLGFRFAPFVFSNLSLLKPFEQNLSKSNLYSTVGLGIRSRNESLIFETIELKGYYFPRLTQNLSPWRIELNTGIRFKYNSTFIKRPEFAQVN
ncbi:MAG: hypothetical protein ABUT20_41530 [Bacteroidota bacterium]